MIDALKQRYPSHRLTCVGHSMRGTALGLALKNYLVTAQLAVCSYWRNWENAADRRRIWFWSQALFPVAVPLCGCLPGRLSDD